MSDFSAPTECLGYAAMEPSGNFQPYVFTRRACGTDDVVIDVKFAGICHSDIHQVREEWGPSLFPMVIIFSCSLSPNLNLLQGARP